LTENKSYHRSLKSTVLLEVNSEWVGCAGHTGSRPAHDRRLSSSFTAL